MNISFYQLTATPLERAIPKLVEKAYDSGMKVLVVNDNEDLLDTMNSIMWTYSSAAFLPHGLASEPDAELQPILLSTSITKANKAELIVITDAQDLNDFSSFTRCFDVFDGAAAETVAAAERRATSYKQDGHDVIYWIQTPQGTWEKKQF